MIAREICCAARGRRSQGNLSRLGGAKVNFECERKNRNLQKDALHNYFIRDDNEQRTLYRFKKLFPAPQVFIRNTGTFLREQDGNAPGRKNLFLNERPLLKEC